MEDRMNSLPPGSCQAGRAGPTADRRLPNRKERSGSQPHWGNAGRSGKELSACGLCREPLRHGVATLFRYSEVG